MSPPAAKPRTARDLLPAPLARLGKRLIVRPRYWSQRAEARRGFRAHGSDYVQRMIFIAGLPKSGTTWLRRMIASFPGYADVLVPDVTRYEFETGGSHDYDLPADIFDRFDDRMLVLMKMHVHGSPHNADLLRRAKVPYVVLHRDLRDVAVSNAFYVRRTPWHPEYPVYHRLDVQETLALFAVRTLPAYVEWVRSWRTNRDPEMSIEISYEDLVADTPTLLGQVAERFGLDTNPETIAEIADRNSFARLSGGGKQGADNKPSFFRKGVAGDWTNHFTPALERLYADIMGDEAAEPAAGDVRHEPQVTADQPS